MIQKNTEHTQTQTRKYLTQEKLALNTLLQQQAVVYFNATPRTSTCLYVHPISLFFLYCHYRLAESFFNPTLLEIFGYETTSKNLNKHPSFVAENHFNLKKLTRTVFIQVSTYYFAKSMKCLFNFTKNATTVEVKNNGNEIVSNVPSLEIFFKNAVWLERELREMLGVFLAFKSDNRCLLLLYGASDFPIRKLFPTQGHRELYYNVNTGTITSTPLGAQF